MDTVTRLDPILVFGLSSLQITRLRTFLIFYTVLALVACLSLICLSSAILAAN